MEPRSPEYPLALFFRTFQSNATLSAFSTASAPPDTKKAWGSSSGMPTRPNVSTKRAKWGVYTSELATLLSAASISRSRKPTACGASPASASWFMPSGLEA